MAPTFEENIQTANILLERGDFENAITHYNEAYRGAQTPEHKIDILNVTAQIELRLNNPAAAKSQFEKSLDILEGLSGEEASLLIEHKAAILNNLARLQGKNNIKKAIEYHKKALAIFQQLAEENPEKFGMHLANTHFVLGEVFFNKKDYYQADKHLKKAIEGYQSVHEDSLQPMADAFTAKAYYHLGEIGQEKSDMYEAQSQYKKAVQLYERLIQVQPQSYRPILAATLNNLGVVFKMWEKYSDAIKYYLQALEQYELLMEQDKKVYAPYYAAALNSLAIVYTEKHEVKDDFFMGSSGFSGFGFLSADNIGADTASPQEEVDKQMAIDYHLQAINIYNELADEQPEVFTHYLATSLHNLAVLYDEKKEPATAETYYQKALGLRRKLADKHLDAFGADTAVTILNLLTLYQSFMEEKVDLSYRKKALAMLDEANARLIDFDDSKAVIKSMKSDMAYFREYFTQADMEFLIVKDAFKKADALSEEIKSVLDPAIKLNFQQQILQHLEPIHLKYPDNEKLINELHYAYADAAWYAIRSGQFAEARTAIAKGKELTPDSDVLQLQGANLLFAEGKTQEAEAIYHQLRGRRNPENEPYEQIIREHIRVLELGS